MSDVEQAKKLFFDALAFIESSDFQSAELRLRDALRFLPENLSVLTNLAAVLLKQNKFVEAQACAEKIISIDANNVEALLVSANCCVKKDEFAEALAIYDKLIALDPNIIEAHNNRGNILQKYERSQEAIAAYDRALALNPDAAEAWIGRGGACTKLSRYAEAFAAFDRALTLQPDAIGLEGDRLHNKLFLCDWRNYDTECAHLISSVRNGHANSPPFPLLAIPSTSADQLDCARLRISNKSPPAAVPLWRGGRYNHDRIRVAYVSSDLCDHPVGRQIVEVFERHDKARFELTAISLKAAPQSQTGSRIKAAVEHFVELPSLTDRKIAEYIHQHEIDIAVDLNGFTDGGRQGAFALRPAPTQVNYLGYAGTLGADYYDYIMADRTVIPANSFGFYRENVVWLPNSFMPTESRRPNTKRVPTRAEQNLRDGSFVFCCFNAPYKLTPEVFAIWMRLLKAIEGSLFWLSGPNDAAKANLRREAEQAGVSPERLIFAERVESHADHLARHRLADLFLDTLPYNAHATAVDALWAGLPVLTRMGATFAGRVAASLLTAVGIPELITQSLEDYEMLALRLAREPALLASIKSKLASNRDTCPLFDTPSFTRHIEAAYSQMWEWHQRGEAPAAFTVEP